MFLEVSDLSREFPKRCVGGVYVSEGQQGRIDVSEGQRFGAIISEAWCRGHTDVSEGQQFLVWVFKVVCSGV